MASCKQIGAFGIALATLFSMGLSFFIIIDVLGILAFAMSGATLAIKKEFDIFGVLVLAFVTATGGGTVRDVLLGAEPVTWMRNSYYLIGIIGGALAAMLFYRWMDRLNFFVYLFDNFGLGLFTVAGIEKALVLDLNPFICVAIGTITATFGGLIRDIISGEKPMLLTRREIYAMASILGGGLYFALLRMGLNHQTTGISTVIFVFLLRHITHRYKISVPRLYPKN